MRQLKIQAPVIIVLTRHSMNRALTREHEIKDKQDVKLRSNQSYETSYNNTNAVRIEVRGP